MRRDSEISVALHDLSIGYGDRKLLDHVNARFEKGHLTALIGRNGSGKSTLLRAIAGLNRNYSGEITVGGEDSKTLDAIRVSRILSLVTTQRTRIPNMTCNEVVSAGRAPYTDWIGRLGEKDRKIVDESIRAVGMEAYAHRTMDTMSDGECQRIMIARALAQTTPVMILDEPTSFLDMPSRYELAELLASLAHTQGKSIIFSTHELDIALEMCDDVALVDNGKLIHRTPELMRSEGWIEHLFRHKQKNSR